MKVSDIASIVFKKSLTLKIQLKKHSSSGVSVKGTPFIPSSFATNSLDFFNLIPVLDDLTKIDPNAGLYASSSAAAFLSALRYEIDKHEEENKVTDDDVDNYILNFGLPGGSETPLRDIEFVREQDSGGKVFVYDKSTRELARIDRAIFESQINILPKEARPRVMARVHIGSVIYHPCLPLGVFKVTRDMRVNYLLNTEVALNLYSAPFWKSEIGHPTLHPTIEKLFRFIFVGDECLEHVFRWAYSLIYDDGRPMPLMVILSPGGIGKGRVFDAVLAPMAGLSNFQKPPSKHNGRFDDYYTTGHLFYSSEAKIDLDNLPRLKDLYDGITNSERKGVDVGKPKRTGARFVFSSNNARDLYMCYDSRKFTVPDVRKSGVLKDNMSREELGFLEEFKTNYQEQANFAAWLRDFSGPLKFEEVWHGEDFKYLCEYHLEGWFKSFRNMLKRNKSFTLDEFRDNLPKGVNKVSANKVEEVVTKYEHEAKTQICEIVPSPDGFDLGVVYNSKIYETENK